jgi:hypothetical protein
VLPSRVGKASRLLCPRRRSKHPRAQGMCADSGVKVLHCSFARICFYWPCSFPRYPRSSSARWQMTDSCSRPLRYPLRPPGVIYERRQSGHVLIAVRASCFSSRHLFPLAQGERTTRAARYGWPKGWSAVGRGWLPMLLDQDGQQVDLAAGECFFQLLPSEQAFPDLQSSSVDRTR